MSIIVDMSATQEERIQLLLKKKRTYERMNWKNDHDGAKAWADLSLEFAREDCRGNQAACLKKAQYYGFAVLDRPVPEPEVPPVEFLEPEPRNWTDV